MAEDKGGGGSSGWEPFEIIVVIILAVGLLSQITGKKITPIVSTEKTKTEEIDRPETTGSTCGLNISRPHPLENVANFVTLSGYTDGCDWASTETVAMYAQVIDIRGTPVSRYETVPVINKNDEGSFFNTTITLTASASKGIGYLILVPAKNLTDYTNTTRIPLTFK